MAKSKPKGDRAERQAAEIFSEWWGSPLVRTPQSGGFATKKFRDGFNASADIVSSDSNFPLSIEVKWREGWFLEHLLTNPKTPIWSWWDQTISQCTEGKRPLLAFTKNRSPWYYMCRSNDFTLQNIGSMNLVDPSGERIIVGLLTSWFKQVTPDMISGH